MNLKKQIIPLALGAILVFSTLMFLLFSNRINEDISQSKIEGLDIAGQLNLNADMTIQSVSSLGNGTYRVTYNYFIANNTENTVYEVKATNNLASAFPGIEFTINSVSSNDLTINNSFNGSSNVNLLSGTDNLASGQNARIEMIVDFIPENSAGPFENNISVVALKEPTQDEDDNEDGGGNQGGGGDEDGNDNGGGNQGGGGGGDDEGGEDNNEEVESPDIDYSNLDLSFWFVNSGENRIIQIGNNNQYEFEGIGPFTIEASTNFEIPGSIKFTILNNGMSTTENNSAYTYTSYDLESLPWNSIDGIYTVLVEVYSEDNLSGDKVYSEEVTFTIVREEDNELEDDASISFELEDEDDEESNSGGEEGHLITIIGQEQKSPHLLRQEDKEKFLKLSYLKFLKKR